jgi:hypothetical protein
MFHQVLVKFPDRLVDILQQFETGRCNAAKNDSSIFFVTATAAQLPLFQPAE